MSENDDLNDLKSAFQAATPKPDSSRRLENISIAQENFAQIQGSKKPERLHPDRPSSGWMRGVNAMLNVLNPRAAIVATTALVAVGLVAVVPSWQKAPYSFDRPTEDVLLEEVFEPEIAEADEAGSVTNGVQPLARSAQSEDQGRKDVVSSLRGEVARAKSRTLENTAEGFASGALQSAAPSLGDAVVPNVAEPQAEAYPDAEQNGLKITAEEPVSTFSIDVDTASYAVVRNSLMSGQLPPLGSVRIEEMLNYFPYDYLAPETDGVPFRPALNVTETPWNPDTKLLHIAIQGEKPAIEDRPPLNLVFLIDTSGSMNQPNKLPLLKQSLSLMLSKLTEQDQIAIVTYAGSAGQVLEPTTATEKDQILGALEQLQAGGSTAGEAGLQQAYRVASEMSKDGEVTRVILATDGDFNVGLSDPEALESYIAEKRETGVFLSVFGFGRGNLDDATMQALAQNGNGQAAYIDTLSEAQKVLVDQFTGALFPIANDVKIQVEFNPTEVAEYRLIGYETRILNRADFNNDRIDAGDIGAGHSVTAIYEITPVGSPARLSDPLRYQIEAPDTSEGELGYFKLRYKEPGQTNSALIELPIRSGNDQMNEEIQFAIAIAGFGQLLRGNRYLGDWSYDDAISLATSSKGEDIYGYRAEAIRLMRLAQSLAE